MRGLAGSPIDPTTAPVVKLDTAKMSLSCLSLRGHAMCDTAAGSDGAVHHGYTQGVRNCTSSDSPWIESGTTLTPVIWFKSENNGAWTSSCLWRCCVHTWLCVCGYWRSSPRCCAEGAEGVTFSPHSSSSTSSAAVADRRHSNTGRSMCDVHQLRPGHRVVGGLQRGISEVPNGDSSWSRDRYTRSRS